MSNSFRKVLMSKIKTICNNNHEMTSKAVADKVVEIFKEYPAGLYCFAGGDTPVRAYEYLVNYHREGIIDLTKAYFVELDEWIGLDEKNMGSCCSYLKRNLFNKINIPENHIHFFDALAQDLNKQCQDANEFIISHNGITCSLLGVGVNGHLGFNEPGVDFNQNAHIIDLSAVTVNVGQKYFVETENVPGKGITLGIKQLLASKYLLLEATGESKQKAITELQKGKVNQDWPVTCANLHENCYLFIDEKVLERKEKGKKKC